MYVLDKILMLNCLCKNPAGKKKREREKGAQCDGLVARIFALTMLGSHMGAGSDLGGAVSHPAPCL